MSTAALRAWQGLERSFDRVFGSSTNPMRHLGALGFLFFWWLALSGIYLFAVLDTSATAAYVSIDRLSRMPWYQGGWLRSVHRYAADAFVVVMVAHLVREWLLGRYQGFRRFSWLTGVPLLLFGFGSGIVGFWLNWDQLGQYSASATAEWLDALPVFASPLTRNFISTAAVSDRLFSLFIFMHVGIPLLMLFGLWFHIQRITRAAVFPPRTLAVASTLGLLVLAIVVPVSSHAPADLAIEPSTLRFDWFLLFVHPLTDTTSRGLVWWLLGAAICVLLGLPFWPQGKRASVAVVDPNNCNGCQRCFVDCPYAAVTMVPHPDWQTPGRPIRQLAQVNADLCASCGICVGACPSSTPFRHAPQLVTGIDMPQQPLDSLRTQLEAGLARMSSARKWVVIGCTCGPQPQAPLGDDVLCLRLICIGMLPPSFVEYALRHGAEGVVVTGCVDGDCAFRFGQRWTEQRLRGEREPHLRSSVPAERWRMVWQRSGEPDAVTLALNELRALT